jgi:uncharacterized membrane protein
MRKRYRVLFFSALVAALIVPVGYALSFESTPKTTTESYAVVMPAAANLVAARAVIQRTGEAQATSLPGPVGDAAKLLFIGTVLFGLAAAVRKVI